MEQVPNEVEKVPNLICTLWNRSSHWNNSINSNSVCKFWNWIDPQFKFQSWNWCYNSNSNSTELGGFQGIPIFVLKSVKKVEKKSKTGVTSSSFGQLVTPGWREENSNRRNPLESPNSVELELELTPQFRQLSWNWGVPKINSKELELECGIVNWPQFFSNDCLTLRASYSKWGLVSKLLSWAFSQPSQI